MNKQIKILSGIAILQVLLIVLVYSLSPSMGAYESGKELFQINAADITKISILSKGGGLMEVVKGTSGWSMPKNFDAPVSKKLMDEFLNKLSSFKKTWPAGKTMEAAREFKTVDGFERRITLNDGKKDHVLILGDSPGIKKIYARVDGENETYPINFELSQASINPKEWIDWDFFKPKKEDVVFVEYKGVQYERNGENFTIADLAVDEELKQQELDSFVAKLLDVEIEDVLGTEEKESYQMSSPYVSWKVKLKNDEEINFSITGLQPENAHVLKISKFPQYFRVSAKTADQLKAVASESFIVKKEVPPPAVLPE